HFVLLAFYYYFLFFRLPPSCTLFPYTTLFRSALRAAIIVALAGAAERRAAARLDARPTDRHGDAGRDDERDPRPLRERSPASDQDRKSTRLNSSHLVISYAVFCLKKKKKKFHL